MMDYFEKNYKILINKDTKITLQNENEYYVGDCLSLNLDGKEWMLQSAKSMTEPVSVWCNQFDHINHGTIIAIFGMGYWQYIEQLSNIYSKNLILVYEPNERVLTSQMKKYDMKNLLEKNNIIWLVGEDRKQQLHEIIDEKLDYKNGFNIVFGSIPNYKKMFADEYLNFWNQIQAAKVYVEVSKNTRINREDARAKCNIYNIYDIAKQSSVINLVEEIKKIELKDVPAVLLSAGPSLDKNIEELAQYQDRVFIVCVDSAIRTAYKYNVVPDLLVCADPEKKVELFENEYGRNLPLVANACCNYKIIKTNKAKRFYCSDNEALELEILKKYNKKLGLLATGGSVANMAFSLLTVLDFKTIILMGQDLSFPNNRIHTAEAQMEEDVDAAVKSGRYFYVDGYDGKPVLTEYQMCVFRMWFEEQVEKFPKIELINSTEGGVYIKGMKHIPLKEALESYAIKKKTDISKAVEAAQPVLTIEEQEDALHRIQEAYDDIPEIVKCLKEQKCVYDKLDELNRKGKYGTKAFKDCMQKTFDFNEKMEHSLTIHFMQLYAKKGEYEVQDMLYELEGSYYDEIKNMIKMGQRLIDAYIEASEKLLDAWNVVMNE